MKCWKCNNDGKMIDILPLGEGSRWSGWGTKVCLCDECLATSAFNDLEVVIDKELAENSTAEGKDLLRYKHEDEMISEIESLPLDVQEKFFNSYAYGDFREKLKPLVWIMNERKRLNDNT